MFRSLGAFIGMKLHCAAYSRLCPRRGALSLTEVKLAARATRHMTLGWAVIVRGTKKLFHRWAARRQLRSSAAARSGGPGVSALPLRCGGQMKAASVVRRAGSRSGSCDGTWTMPGRTKAQPFLMRRALPSSCGGLSQCVARPRCGDGRLRCRTRVRGSAGDDKR